MTATVLPSGLGAAGEPIACDVVDNGDGTYACTYVVHRRGDYSVSVELDGSSIAGSPFPVFFSAAPTAPAPAPGAPVPGAVPGAVPGTIPGASLSPGAADPASAHQVDEMQRTLCVKNVSSLVTVDQLRELFSFCGKVVDCRVAGADHQFAFVEFETNAEAVKALGLNAMVLGDRALRVEMSRTARKVQPAASVATPPDAPQVPSHVLEQQRRIADAQRTQAELLAKMAAERAAKRAAEIERRLSGDGADRPDASTRRAGRSRSRSRSASRGRGDSPEGRGRPRRRDDSRSRSRSRSRDRRRGFGRRSRGGRRGRRGGRRARGRSRDERSRSRDERSRSRDRSRGRGGGDDDGGGGGGRGDEPGERRDEAKEGAGVDGVVVDAGETRADATAAE